jgi:hypothetical protein
MPSAGMSVLPIIEKSMRELEKEKYPVRDMIKKIVLSEPFSKS